MSAVKLPEPWRAPEGRDPNAEAAALKRRLARVSEGYFRSRRRGVPFWAVVTVLAAGMFAGVYWAVASA